MIVSQLPPDASPVAIGRVLLTVLEASLGGTWSAFARHDAAQRIVVATRGESPFRIGDVLPQELAIGTTLQAIACNHGDSCEATLLMAFAHPLGDAQVGLLEALSDHVATLLWSQRQAITATTQAAVAARSAELEGHLARANKVSAMSLLSAGLYHELCNPLLIAGSYLETMPENLALFGQLAQALDAGDHDDVAVLVDRCDLPEALAHLQNAQRESRMALLQAALVLRDFRSVTAEGPAAEPYDVGELCEAVVRIVRPTYGPGVVLQVVTTPVGGVAMRRSALHQVILNLLINGCQAAGDGGRVLVSVGTDVAGGGAVITVSNDGAGVDPAILPRLFQPFVTTKTATGGSGLGLAICRQLLDEAGGTIAVDLQPDWTTFRVMLPYAA